MTTRNEPTDNWTIAMIFIIGVFLGFLISHGYRCG